MPSGGLPVKLDVLHGRVLAIPKVIDRVIKPFISIGWFAKPYNELALDNDCSFNPIFLYASQDKTFIALPLSTSILFILKLVTIT